MKGAIRGLALDTVKNYVFTGGYDDGEIAILDIEKPGRVIIFLFIIKRILYENKIKEKYYLIRKNL